ncbi:Polysaccharide export lipoprotein Wza [Candidatus Burkholderia humilis]|nr:Polysaccharide export lipoprotein Wza [Candidatus Burkholderia humilis]
MKDSIPRGVQPTSRDAIVKRALVLSLSGLLAACASAPGMRMDITRATSSSEARETGASGASDASGAPAETQVEATAATPAIPLTELDLGLVRQLTAKRKTRVDQQAQKLISAPEAYTVGAGDVLQIVVWDHPEFAAAQGTGATQTPAKPSDSASGFVVDQKGNLHFPYAGVLAVAGLRTDQIQARLTSAPSKYLVKPQLTVRMASYRSREVYVDGEVRNPGALSITDVPLNFYDAIARAGGFSDSANQSDVMLVRNGVSNRINVPQMLVQGVNPSKLYLKAGDLLRISSRDESDVYVMGEVNKPGSAVPRRDGRLSLADALTQAGSVNSNTADTVQMFVTRSNEGKPEVYHLDSRSPVAMLVAKDFDLQPKDVVYVDGNSFVRFNRVLSLLMPLIQTGLTAGVIAK